MPGAVPHTSTYALTNVTLPYALEIANRGIKDAVAADAALGLGVNVVAGQLTSGPVAQAHGTHASSLFDALALAPRAS
jgi:alanine dehydrogenase